MTKITEAIVEQFEEAPKTLQDFLIKDQGKGVAISLDSYGSLTDVLTEEVLAAVRPIISRYASMGQTISLDIRSNEYFSS